ncbi:MAG: hypothetical protein JWQ71_4867, partial [Pedosphaera sp.]|nr:hypothetical protein [Pedosphaera sp.]
AEEIKTAQLQGTAPIKQPGISAQADIQNKIKEHQIKAAQSEAERRTNESKAKAQEAIHRTPPGRTFDPAALGQINKLLAINPDLKGVNASVVSNNIIQLNGLVKTPELKKRAGALVGKIQGVREIQNNITVKE